MARSANLANLAAVFRSGLRRKNTSLTNAGRCTRALLLRTTLAAISVAATQSARAQDANPDQPVPGAERPAVVVEQTDPRPSVADVYLNDSLEAADELTRADEMAKRGRWSEAAEIVHRISDSVGEKLVQRNAGGAFVSVRMAVSRMVTSWPRQGQAAYAGLAEPALQSALRRHAETRQIEPILRLFERYFATPAAAVLADRIGQAAIEAGDFGLAESVYHRVLQEHPDREAYREPYGAMLALLAAMRGGTPAEPLPEARLRWQGQDQSLADVLKSIDRGFVAHQAADEGPEWNTFGGNPQRDRAAGPTIGEPGLLWRAPLGSDGHADTADPAEPDWSEPVRGLMNSAVPAFPVVGDGRVYVQRNREVAALHLGSGAVAWRFIAESASEPSEMYPDDRPPDATSPTYADGRVLASIPAEEPVFYQYDPARRGAELLSLDAADGRLLWRIDARALQLKPGELALDTSPIVAHDSVYVIARRRRTFGFEDSYLCRFSVVDGSLVFRVHLGSASTGAYVQQAAVVPALHDGVLYACSGLGSVSAISAYTGEVKWARTYPRGSAGDGPAVSPAPSSRVVMNPVLRWDDRIVLLPPDGEGLLVLNADSGATLQTTPRAVLHEVDTLLGIRGSLLCGIGGKAFCLDLSSGAMRMVTGFEDQTKLSGRGVWAGDELLAPAENGLLRIPIAGGPSKLQRWDGMGRGGNLLAFADRLIVAELEGVASYVPKANIWKSLRERMTAAPTDPLPAVELAEVAMGAGEYLEAIEVLREAAGRLQATAEDHTTIRKRMFADVLKLAGMLVARGETNAVMLQSLCNDAAEHAGDAASNVEFRLRFGRLFERIDRPTAAVRLYQQILLDRTLRMVETDGPSGTPLPAAAMAERRISGLIAEHGDEVYAEYEAEAGLWLTQAVDTGQEDLFRRIMESFPNARATGMAFVAYADTLAAGGRSAEAWRLYVQAYGRYGGSIDRVPLIIQLIDTLIELKKPELAWRWLEKAERDVPRRGWTGGDARTSLQELRQRLGALRGPAVTNLPRLAPPLESKPAIELEAGARLLIPRIIQASDASWSKFFIRTPSGIVAYHSDTAERAWFAPTEQKKESDLLVARKGSVVLATLYETFALHASTGLRHWQIGRKPDHVGDPGGDWEQGGALRAHAVQDDLLISVRDNGEITAVSIDTGDILWQQTYRPAAFGRVSIADPWVVYHVIQEGRTRICVVDAGTGAWLGEIMTDESRPVEDLFATIDGKVVVVTSRAVSAYCLHTHVKLWSVTLSGQVRPGSLAIGASDLYFSENGLDVQRIELTRGTVAWQSERVADRGVDDLIVQLTGESLVASTPTSVVAIDVHTGLRQWEATLPARPRLDHRLLTELYLLAIDTGGEVREQSTMAYFYEHAQGGGAIPQGGGVDLGRLAKVRGVLAVDGGLLIETEGQVRPWLRSGPGGTGR